MLIYNEVRAGARGENSTCNELKSLSKNDAMDFRANRVLQIECKVVRTRRNQPENIEVHKSIHLIRLQPIILARLKKGKICKFFSRSKERNCYQRLHFASVTFNIITACEKMFGEVHRMFTRLMNCRN